MSFPVLQPTFDAVQADKVLRTSFQYHRADVAKVGICGNNSVIIDLVIHKLFFLVEN